ncbi:hypothetical protein [Candidatus Poriferisocius sp.]|uniref:hypothetical protein n=1 Tax=Candidatus Poriferisocius sp. TaxID=3101276 RepID=UPI003B5A8A85
MLVLGALMLGLSACGDDDQPDLSAFCQKLETAFGPEGALASDYSDDPSAAAAVVDELEAIRRVAPLEIEPSLATINATASLIIEAFDNPEDLTLEAEQLQQSETAAVELARYSIEHCGLRLDWESPVVFVDPDKIPGEVRLDVRG